MGRRITLDAETDGLLHSLTMFHNIGIKDYDTGEKFMFSTREGNIEEGVKMASEAEAMIGHNILGFDIPALEMVYPDFDFRGKIKDTLIISRLLWSNRADLDMKLIRAGTLEGRHMGRHNLESWGQRLGDLKGDFSQWCHDRDIDPWGDWGWEGTYEFEGRTIKKKGEEDRIIEPETIHWSDVYDMRTDYCDQDVEVAEKLFDYEMDTMDLWDYTNFPAWCEHRFEEILGHSQTDGFCLNVGKAEALEEDIIEHLTDFNAQCKEAFPSKFEPQDGYMTVEDVEKMLENLLEKQEKRRVAACQKGKELKKIYDYKPLVEFIDFLKENEVNEIPKIKAAARTSKVTHKMPDGEKFSSVIEAGTVKTAVEFKDFNPNSRPQIVEKLLELGWEPEVYTDAGNPSTAGDTLEEAANVIPICKPIAGGLKCTKIKSYIRSKEGAKAQNGWLNVVRDGKIHARTVHIGAATHRVAISKPNIGQIPSVEEYPKGHEKEGQYMTGFEGGWGLECRGCFEVPKGWWLMGTDLAGIEVRLLAEEMSEFDDGEYIAIVLEGDIHETNREAANLPTRGAAKTFLYACVPLDTQALTSEGWKDYEELEVGELVLTYNQKDNVKEWKPILEKVYYEDAEVIEMSHSNSFKVRSTPNHRWFINQRRRSPDYKRPYLRPMIKTTEEINTESNIINNAPFRDNRILESYDCGRVNDRPKYEVDWVAEIMKMSVSEMSSFLMGFIVADGNYQYGNESRTNGHWKWSQNTGNIQEAALMATYLVHDGRVHMCTRTDTPSEMKITHLNNKAHTTGQKLIKKQMKNQPVWCVRTENESFVMRQGDCITITGNTIYGIGDLALGGRLNPSLKENEKVKLGKNSKKNFFREIPAAKKAVKKYKKEAKNGFITALDGRRVPVDSGHKALNYRLQNGGAIIAKLWAIYFYDAMLDAGYDSGYDGDFVIAAFVHDELQVPCRTKEIAEHAGRIAEEQSLIVGKFFGISIPIESNFKIGKSWAETH